MQHEMHVQARALALSSLGSQECAELLVQLPEDELAAVLACLTDGRRKQLMQELTELDAHLAECAYDTMRCCHACQVYCRPCRPSMTQS